MLRPRSVLLIAVLSLAGCGTTGSGDGAPPTATPAVAADERSVDAIEEQLQDLARRKDAAVKAGETATADELERAMRRIERTLDEAIEEEFAGDEPYDRALDRLPLRRPPLYVEQLELDDSHELVVRVRARRFFCGRSQDERLAAVRAYFEQAQTAMQANGIDDFALVVDTPSEVGRLRPLARAKGTEVALTARGRGPGAC